MKCKLITVALLLLITNVINCQSYSKDSLRTLYIYSGVGIYEWFNIGVGYQLNNQFSVSLKHANTWVSGSGCSYLFPPNAGGLACEIKYYKDIWIFNNISAGYIYFLYVPNEYDMSYGINPKGGGFEFNLGNERIEKRIPGGLQIYWSVGIGINYNKAYSATLVMPSAKIGIYYNLF
ncbi:MAG TPA: hypothetical protein PK397_09255 [Ignavibacteriaceae bacterium]|nr:hypothetical protein [Ignavibacteriaceae bacterium]